MKLPKNPPPLLVILLLLLACGEDPLRDIADSDLAAREPSAGTTAIGPPTPQLQWTCAIATNVDWHAYHYFALGNDFFQGQDPAAPLVPIEYNNLGDPARVKVYGGHYDSTLAVYTYDLYSRLKRIVRYGYVHFSTGLNYTTSYSFSYQGTTSITVTRTTNPSDQAAPFNSGYTKLLLDTEGRVKEKREYLTPTDVTAQFILKYAYNAAGNLSNITYIVPNEGQMVFARFDAYDTKKNVYKTNKVWQLLMEQYSNNNPTDYTRGWPGSTSKIRFTTTYQYNLPGYPVSYETLRQDYYPGNGWQDPCCPVNKEITYNCHVVMPNPL